MFEHLKRWLEGSSRRETVSGMLESLEPRQLMAVDLAGAFTSVPASVLSGTRQNLTLNIANYGDTARTGSLTVAFYLAPDGAALGDPTTQLVRSFTRSIALPAFSADNFTFSLQLSAALAAGNYRIFAVIDPANQVAESDETNNTAQSAVMAVVQPNYDLSGSFSATTRLLPAVILGQGTGANVKVALTNTAGSTVRIPSGTKVAVQIVARPVGASDDSQDIVLNRSPVNFDVGGLAAGKSRPRAIPIVLPASLSAGDYDIVLKIDTGAALAETDETNNEAVFGSPVTVAAPFADPSVDANAAVTLPASAVADGRTLKLKFDLGNQGNISIPAGTTGSLLVVAHNISTDADTTLGTYTVNLSGIGPGRTRTVAVTSAVAQSLVNGAYTIEGVLTTGLAGDDGSNNNAAFGSNVAISDPFYNLGVTGVTSRFAPAVLNGLITSGSVDVAVKNLSNTFIASGEKANITVSLRPVGATSNASDVVIALTDRASLSGLAIGATRTYRLPATIPATVAGGAVLNGSYELVATVTPATLVETTTADNTLTGSGIIVSSAFTDLAIVSASTTFPTPSPSGMRAIGRVVLQNTGNTVVSQTITLHFFAVPQGSSTDVAELDLGTADFTVTLAPGQTSAPLNTALLLTPPVNGFSSSAYDVYARIDPSFTDANAANSQLPAGGLTVSSAFVDLRVMSASNPFSGSLLSNSTGTGFVTLGNVGSGLAGGTVAVTYYASTTTHVDGASIPLGTADVYVTLGSAQMTVPVGVTLTLPQVDVSTNYNILVQITPLTPTVDNNLNNNTTTSLGVITVLPPTA